MKKRRTLLPKGCNSTFELKGLVPWEEAFTDSSGKFRRKSKQGNKYFTVFVCAKTGDKIAIPHVKRKQFPLVYFEFTKKDLQTSKGTIFRSSFGNHQLKLRKVFASQMRKPRERSAR